MLIADTDPVRRSSVMVLAVNMAKIEWAERIRGVHQEF